MVAEAQRSWVGKDSTLARFVGVGGYRLRAQCLAPVDNIHAAFMPGCRSLVIPRAKLSLLRPTADQEY